MNSFRARRKDEAIEVRLFVIVCRAIDDAKAMGFNVIYFPPIHPIGHTNRKGRNNSVTVRARAIQVSPGQLATRREDTRRSNLTWARWRISIGWSGEVRKRGMEIALDFAHQLFSRSPVREGASGMVLPTPRRHD